MALAQVHAGTGMLDRRGVNLCVPQSACTRGWLRPLPDSELGPARAGGKESLRPLGDEPPQTERTDHSLRSLHDEDGGVGQRYRASSTPHAVWVGLDAADCLTRNERTGHEYIRVRPLF